MPSCSVQLSAECPGSGWSFLVASLAPSNSGANWGATPRLNPPFHPHLADAVILPVGEQTDAVAAGKDFLQVVLQLIHGQVLVDHLSHLKGRLHVERDLGDYADRPQVHHCPLESIAIPLPGENQHLTVGRDHFQPGYGRGQISILVARAVGGRGDGAGDRNLR